MANMPLDTPSRPEVENYGNLKELVKNENVKKYTEKYESAKKQAVEQKKKQIADEKRLKRREFFLKFLDAAIGGIVALAIEHISDIVRFFHDILQKILK